MSANYFSVPIFFVIFRECLEASIIISVLLALAEQLVSGFKTDTKTLAGDAESFTGASDAGTAAGIDDAPIAVDQKGLPSEATLPAEPDAAAAKAAEAGVDAVAMIDMSSSDAASTESHDKALLRRLRMQIFAGAGAGLLVAMAIGAAFLIVFYTKVTNLWANAEDLWEGIFSLLASVMIWVMGITMLRMDRAKIKWKIKMQKAFERDADIQNLGPQAKQVHGSNTGKWALFLLPFFTVLREGLEAVIFVGGVSLAEAAQAIPIAAVVGAICGLGVGFLLYKSSSRMNLSIFLIVSTAFLLLIGAGLFSKAVGDFERYKYNQMVGADVAEVGNGPGSYEVHGNVWHLNCCNPEVATEGYGWQIFNSILGWTHNATLGSILSYIFYWLAVIAALVRMKWKEGRVLILGYGSPAWHRRYAAGKVGGPKKDSVEVA